VVIVSDCWQTVFHSIDHHWSADMFATCGQQVDVWCEERTEPVRSFTWGVDSINSIKFNPIEVWLSQLVLCYYLHHVNEVNGRVTVFVRCVSVCLSVCLCVCSGTVSQTSLKRLKTIKATDFNFDKHVPSPAVRTWPLKNYYSVKIHLAKICTLTSAF